MCAILGADLFLDSYLQVKIASITWLNPEWGIKLGPARLLVEVPHTFSSSVHL